MGPALAFNLLGEDARKTEPRQNEHWKGRSCDLKSAGYRILTKATPTGPTDMIQFAFALDAPVTTWQACDLSVLIDADGDGVADQELAGTAAGPGIFQTVLLNAAKAREVRRAYEMEIASGKEVTPNYQPAILGMGPMAAFPHSTLAIIEAPVSSLATTNGRDLRLKLAAQGGRDVVESDDYLGAGLGDWKNVSISPDAQPFKIETEVIPVGKRTVSGAIARGSGKGKLVLYYPINDRAAGQWQVLR